MGDLRAVPVLLATSLLFLFVLTYILAIILKDVEPIFPYISDTGSFAPESCIFGFLLNLSAFLLSILIFLRFSQIQTINLLESTKIIPRLNLVCLFFGLVCALGLAIVANFQVINAFNVHMIGAIMTYSCGNVYQPLMCLISQKLNDQIGISKTVLGFRMFFTIVSLISVGIMGIFGILSFSVYNGSIKDLSKWNKDVPGYKFHLCSTFGEWISSISTALFILTFYWDLKLIKLKKPFIETI